MKTTSRLSIPVRLSTLLALLVALISAFAVPSGTAHGAPGLPDRADRRTAARSIG